VERGKPDGAARDHRKERVDYRETLTPEQFAVYARLREARKRIAERDGVPPYAVFSNEQFAEVIRRGVRTAAELARVDGVGSARREKYGAEFLVILAAQPAAPAASDAPK